MSLALEMKWILVGFTARYHHDSHRSFQTITRMQHIQIQSHVRSDVRIVFRLADTSTNFPSFWITVFTQGLWPQHPKMRFPLETHQKETCIHVNASTPNSVRGTQSDKHIPTSRACMHTTSTESRNSPRHEKIHLKVQYMIHETPKRATCSSAGNRLALNGVRSKMSTQFPQSAWAACISASHVKALYQSPERVFIRRCTSENTGVGTNLLPGPDPNRTLGNSPDALPRLSVANRGPTRQQDALVRQRSLYQAIVRPLGIK